MIRNLYNELLKAVSEKDPNRRGDTRFQALAKEVKKVLPGRSNGYAFDGDWVQKGTVEVAPGPRVYLVMTANGSRRYQRRHYSVVVMDADGNLNVTDIYTTDKTRGWALRIRDQVAELLGEMAGEKVNPLADFSTEQLIEELKHRGAL